MAQDLLYSVGLQAFNFFDIVRTVVDQANSQGYIILVLKFYRRADTKVIFHFYNTAWQETFTVF